MMRVFDYFIKWWSDYRRSENEGYERAFQEGKAQGMADVILGDFDLHFSKGELGGYRVTCKQLPELDIVSDDLWKLFGMVESDMYRVMGLYYDKMLGDVESTSITEGDIWRV